MTYKINGVALIDQPEKHQWRSPARIGTRGDARIVYSGVWGVQLQWGTMTIAGLQQLMNNWIASRSTGSMVVELPDPLQATYAFREFSGVSLEAPTVGTYYAKYVTGVKLKIVNIQVE